MPARTPEELDVLFASAINAGDIEAVIKLYEPGACLMPFHVEASASRWSAGATTSPASTPWPTGGRW